MASKDAAALDVFYERYNRVAFGLVLRIVGNRADAEDVLVDLFASLAAGPEIRSSRGKPLPGF